MSVLTGSRAAAIRCGRPKSVARLCSSAAGGVPALAQPQRRSLLAITSLFIAAAQPALAAVLDDRGYVDQSFNRAKGDCALGEDGKDCRLKSLKDADTLSYESQLKVGTMDGGNRGTVTANGSATAGRVDTKYLEATNAVMADARLCLDLDVLDPERGNAVERLKKAGNAWSSAYAPGGSSKRASGRALYNALNQLQGHFAFNGLAAVPRSTREKVERNLADTRTALDSGR